MNRLEFMKGFFGIAAGASLVGEAVAGNAFAEKEKTERGFRLTESLDKMREKFRTMPVRDVLVRGARQR